MKNVLFLIVVFFATLAFGQNATKPQLAYPFDDVSLQTTGMTEQQRVTMQTSNGDALTGSTIDNGGARLVSTQNADGGWGWPLIGSSAPNTVGPIAKGLAQAYSYSFSATQKTSLSKSKVYLLGKTNNFSPSDGYLAKALDEVFGGTTCRDHLNTSFYGPLAAGTYNRLGINYSTASYINLIRTVRSGSQANMAAWDIGMGLVGAASCGAATADWIAGVKAEIDELDGNNYYDVIGLAGALYGLAFVDEEFDPTAGTHAAATNLSDLANILADQQYNNGGFCWWFSYPVAGYEAIQETSYAILALNEVDRSIYLTKIQGAADYMANVQLTNGGWSQYVGYGENNEITGEALWGYTLAYSTIENSTKGTWHMTIQAAINAASPGDVINVPAGTYAEKVTINKSVSLIGSPGAVLNGTGLGGNGFLIQAPNITINGFEIENYQIGIRTYGGPASYGDLQILNCNIHHNTQNGMLFVYDIFNTVLLENNQITGNTQNGIGIANNATIANLHLENCNSSNGQHGMFIANAALNNVLIENSDFNNATSYGSCGITFSTTKSTVGSFTMTGGSLSGNTGGGLYVAQAPTTLSSFTLDGVIIQNNHESGILLGGGGSAGNLSIANCAFQGNAWEDYDLSGGWFGAFSVPGTVTVTGCIFGSGAWSNIYIGNAGAFGNINVNQNSFVPGAWRIYNTNEKIVDATCNWWGSISPGGNTVTSNVIKVPWLTDGTDNSLDPGFQPSVACVACEELSCDITALPGSGPYTGDDPNIIYLGYGPQSVTLSSTVSGGSATAYSWSGPAGLSCTTCASPVFTTTSEGIYEFTLTVTFTNGCTTTCSITICVLDIIVPGSKGKKVYLCHVPPGNPNNPQTLSVNLNAVPAHVPGHPLDHLGRCDQYCPGNGPQGGEGTGELIVSADQSISTIVYPNPFTYDFTVTVETESQEPIQVIIYDLTGRRLQELKDILPNTPLTVANNLQDGIYILYIQQGDQIQKVKIIKHR